uniref:CSON003506 protein n=1 Tax=Culicoides sonorensis TaxID=179676 RepID=A0A336LVL2_CULSO
MQDCCGNEEKEQTFREIFNSIFLSDNHQIASATKTIIFQTAIVFAFFILIAYSFLKGSPIVQKDEDLDAKKSD